MYMPTMTQQKTAVYLLLMPTFAMFSFQSAKLANFCAAKQLLGLLFSSKKSYPQVASDLDVSPETRHAHRT